MCPAGAELFCEGGQTDVAKLIDAFRSFAKAPEKVSLCKK